MRTTLFLLALALCGIVGASFMLPRTTPEGPELSAQPGQHTWSRLEPIRAEAAQAFILPVTETSYLPFRNSSVLEPALDAKAAIVYDTRSGRYLYEKNATERLPIASLTKLLAVLVARDIFDPGVVITIPSEAVRVDGEKQDLYAGERLTVADLIRFMLVSSSNDAAYALAFHAKANNIDFVARMNDKAAALGMHDTQVLDPAGLNDKGISTPRDLVKLAVAAIRIPSLWPDTRETQITITSQDGQVHTLKNTNQLLGDLPNIVAGKTGYTEGALGCLILAVNVIGKDDILVSIVLGSRERFTDTSVLLGWIERAYRWE